MRRAFSLPSHRRQGKQGSNKKDTLKALGCRWHSKRNCWYWTPEERRSFYSKKGLGALAAQYGASEIVGDDDGRKGSTKQQRRRTWRPAALAA